MAEGARESRLAAYDRAGLTHSSILRNSARSISSCSSLSDKFKISRWSNQLLQRFFISAPRNANSSGHAISADGGRVSHSSTLRGDTETNRLPSCFSAQYAVCLSRRFHFFGRLKFTRTSVVATLIGDGPSKPANRCTNCVEGNLSCTYVEFKVVGPPLTSSDYPF